MPELPDDLAALLRAHADHAPVPPAASDTLVRAVRRRQYLRAGAFASGTALAVVAVVGVATAVVPTDRRANVQPAAPAGPTPDPQSGCGYVRVEATPIGTSADGTASPAAEEHGVVLSGGPGTQPPVATETDDDDPEPAPAAPDETSTIEPTADPTEDPGDEPRGPDYGFTVDIADPPAFDRAEYQTANGTTCMVVTNDNERRHDLELRSASGRAVWEVPLDKGMSVIVDDEPLAPGRYDLVCTIHPAMRATVRVS